MTKTGYNQVLVSTVVYKRLKTIATENNLSLGRTIAKLLESKSIDTVSIPHNPVNNPSLEQEPRAKLLLGNSLGGGPDRIRTDDLRRVRPTFLPSHGFLAS